MKKILLIILVLVINITGCNESQPIKDDIVTTQVVQNEDISKIEVTDNKASQDITKNREIYIWNACMLGGYDTESNKWISPYPLNVVKDYERITFEDVLSKEAYYLYNNDNEYVKDLRTIVFPYSPGHLLSDFEGTEELIKLNKLEILDINHPDYMFDLPISNKDILDINYPGDSFAIDFDRDDSSDLATRNWLASSTNKIEFFSDQQGNNLQNIPEKTKEVVYNMFLEKGYDKVVPFYRYCFQGDFDNDGYDEYLTVANNDTTVISEVVVSTTGKAAYFYVIIFQDNDGDVQVIEDYLKTPDEDTLSSSSENEKRYFDLYYDEHLLIRNVAIVDLNNDGNFEILLEEITNRPRYKVYSLENNNHYTLVMETLLIMPE